METAKDEITSAPRNTKELANHYGITPKTFRSWLKKANLDLGTRLGNYFSPRQVRIIVAHMGAKFLVVLMAILKWIFGSNHGHDSGDS
jgi:hypothetical protein